MFLASLRVQEYTRTGYQTKLDLFMRYAGAETLVDAITEKTFWGFVESRKNLSINSQANYARHLRLFFNWLVKHKHIQQNPIPVIKQVKTSIRTISSADKKVIFDYLKKNFLPGYNFVTIMDFTGMRPGEVQNLSWQQFDFNQKILNIWNNKEGRFDQFPLYGKFLTFVKKLKPKKEGLLFPDLQKRSGIEFFKRACKKLGLAYSIYDLRRTFGSDNAPHMTEIELATLMRHRNIETTRRYYISLNLHQTAKKIAR